MFAFFIANFDNKRDMLVCTNVCSHVELQYGGHFQTGRYVDCCDRRISSGYLEFGC